MMSTQSQLCCSGRVWGCCYKRACSGLRKATDPGGTNEFLLTVKDTMQQEHCGSSGHLMKKTAWAEAHSWATSAPRDLTRSSWLTLKCLPLVEPQQLLLFTFSFQRLQQLNLMQAVVQWGILCFYNEWFKIS